MSKKLSISLIVVGVLVALVLGVFALKQFGLFSSTSFAPGSYGVDYDTKSEEAAVEMGFARGESVSFGDDAGDGGANPVGDIERLIIRTGNISMIVDDVRAAVEAITQYASGNGGFVVSSNVYKSGIYVSGDITVRIPVNVFESGMAEIKAMGEVTHESSYGQDVTEEYVDLDARMRNLKATESQFLAILEQADEVEDILAVQKELTWVREEIERIEGRMKYLQDSADLATLSVYLSTDPNALPVIDEEETWKPLAIFKDALRSLLEFGKGVVNASIWVGVYIPVLLVVVLIGWGIYRLFTRKGRKKGKK